MIKAVFDTNTILSGVLWSGNESRLIELAEIDQLELYTSQEILREVERVLEYDRIQKILAKSDLTQEEIIEKITELSHVVNPAEKIDVIKADTSDNRILECAIAGEVHYIVSGDEHLLKLKDFRNIRIVRSRELLDEIVGGI